MTNLRVDADLLNESDSLKLKSLNTIFCQEFLGVSTLDQTGNKAMSCKSDRGYNNYTRMRGIVI